MTCCWYIDIMQENEPNPDSNEDVPSPEASIVVSDQEQKRELTVALALTLEGRGEALPFPGIKPEAYAKIKADEEEFPGYGTPIDELLARCASEGMRVVVSKNAQSGNAWVVPMGSADELNDVILLKHLDENAVTDISMQELLAAHKG